MKKIAVSLLALTLAVFLAVPAMAEFEPYGEVKLITGWWDVEGNDAEPGKSLTALGYDVVDDDEDLVWDLCNFSVFGAKFKTGDLGGHVEFELLGDENGNGVDIALLYGTWDFAGGTLKVGQDHTPYTFPSAQIAPGLSEHVDGDNRFIGFGCLWDWYQPQIELKLENGFYVALIQPERASEADAEDLLGDPGDADLDTTVPKICVGYEFKTEGLMLNPGFAYNTYEVESDSLDWDEDVDSWLLYLNGKVDLGPATIQGSLHYGQNLGDEHGFGLVNREAFASAQIDYDGDIEDSDCYGGYIQVAFNIDPATITLGYGYTLSETDSDLVEDFYGDDEDDQQSFFINCKIPIADTFFVVPEFSYYDMMEIGDHDEPEAWFLGLMWQMDF